MLRRRLLYAAALLAAWLFFLFFEGWFALFLLVTLLLLPLLSLALSLPAALGCTLSLSAVPGRVLRDGDARWELSLRTASPFPLPRFTARLRTEDLFAGGEQMRRVVLAGRGEGCVHTQAIPTGRCTRLSCAVEKPRVCDLLGLFSLRLPAPEAVFLSVLPRPSPPGPVPQLTGGRGHDLGWKPRPGGGPGEDYDLREYRPGDPMRSVHWKLSSKLDGLVVRETLEPRRSAILITFDHFGTPDELDAVLDRLSALSQLLLKREAPHYIQWAHPLTGQVNTCAVTDEGSLLSCLDQILSQPAPAEGRSILDGGLQVPGGDGRPRHLHVTPALWQEGGGL